MEVRKEQMIGQGNTAEIYRLDHNKILKLFRSGLDKGVIEREYKNSIIIQSMLECVPKIYEMVDVNHRNGIIYEEIHGQDMLKIMVGSTWKINEYARKLAHFHLSIQKPVKDGLCTVKEKLIEEINRVDLLSHENKEILRKYIEQLPEGNTLCHFDFHPGNIMLTHDEKIVLDWMTACKGDGCSDVARTCLMLKYGEVQHAPWLRRRVISIFQRHIYKIYISEYLKVSNKKMESISLWELPIAAARLGEWISPNEKKKLLQLVNERCIEVSNT